MMNSPLPVFTGASLFTGTSVSTGELNFTDDLANKSGRYPLMLATFFSLRQPLLHAILPRLCYLVLYLAQPLLIKRAIEFVGDRSQNRSKEGQRLILATAVIYVGLAVCSWG
jgi:hypothetical protein